MLEGRLAKGLGEGAAFTAIDWVARAFNEILGYAPYPGTVNLTMSGPSWEQVRPRLRQAPGMVIEPPPGFCSARCILARINGRLDGAIVLPEVAGYPADKLEFVAPVPVRQTLRLIEGDPVALEVRLA